MFACMLVVFRSRTLWWYCLPYFCSCYRIVFCLWSLVAIPAPPMARKPFSSMCLKVFGRMLVVPIPRRKLLGFPSVDYVTLIEANDPSGNGYRKLDWVDSWRTDAHASSFSSHLCSQDNYATYSSCPPPLWAVTDVHLRCPRRSTHRVPAILYIFLWLLRPVCHLCLEDLSQTSFLAVMARRRPVKSHCQPLLAHNPTQLMASCQTSWRSLA